MNRLSLTYVITSYKLYQSLLLLFQENEIQEDVRTYFDKNFYFLLFLLSIMNKII
jgi:hypothetical protein